MAVWDRSETSVLLTAPSSATLVESPELVLLLPRLVNCRVFTSTDAGAGSRAEQELTNFHVLGLTLALLGSELPVKEFLTPS